jgi:hypothetical protein
MHLDLRIPLGWMFTLAGLILAFFGLRTNGNTTVYAASQGINVNLWWGLVLAAFGLSMFLLSRRDQTPPDTKRLSGPDKPKARRSR